MHMATQIWVNAGWGIGLVLYSTKPLPEPILNSDECGFVTFTWEHKCPSNCAVSGVWKLYFWNFTATFSRDQWVKMSASLVRPHCVYYEWHYSIYTNNVDVSSQWVVILLLLKVFMGVPQGSAIGWEQATGHQEYQAGVLGTQDQCQDHS